jgi:hypothetical protein
MLIKAKTYAKTYAKQKGNSLGVLRCSTNIVVSPISISRQFTPIYRQTFTFRLKPSMAH